MLHYTGTTTGSPSVATSGDDTILTYNSSGTYTSSEAILWHIMRKSRKWSSDESHPLRKADFFDDLRLTAVPGAWIQ